MTPGHQHQCRCGQPAPDSTLCPDCTNTLARALADVPALDAELTTVLARQSKGSSVHVGYVMSSPTRPMPYDPGASAVASALRATLVAWVRLVHDEQPEHPTLPRNTLPDLARWLTRRVGWLAQHEAGADALGEIFDAVEACRRVAYRQAVAKLYRGPCTAEYRPDDESSACCLADLYARGVGARQVTCGQCGQRHDAEERRAWLLESAGVRLFTQTELVTLLRDLLERPVPRATVASWVRRGRLIPHGQDMMQRPTYLLSDALALIGTADLPAGTSVA